MDELLKFDKCKFVHPLGLTGANYDQKILLNEETSRYSKIQREVLQELELDVEEKPTIGRKKTALLNYENTDAAFRKQFGKTLGIVAFSRKQENVGQSAKADDFFLKHYKSISR